jgi:hypothetical protein
MERICRRKFLKKAGKLALAGTAAFSMGPTISHFVTNPLKLAFASETPTEFYVYNDVNPNSKDIVAHTFKDCLAKEWWPGICYKTSKPMVAAAAGTVTDVVEPENTTSHLYENIRKEKNPASGFLVKVNHGNNYRSYYLHLKAPEVKSLQKVKRGQIIGYPDKRWNMPRLVFRGEDAHDPNNYGLNHDFMTYWDGNANLEIGKKEQNQRFENQKEILNKIAAIAEGSEKYDLLRKKHKGMYQYKWSSVEKFRYIEYLIQNKPETFPSLTKEQFEEMKAEFYSNQPIVLTLPFKRG